MTPAERAYLQALIDNMYGQFVQAVADGRHAKPTTFGQLPTAECGPGRRLCHMNLIDQIGDFQNAVERYRASRLELRASPRWCIPRKIARRCWTCFSGIFRNGLPTREKLLEQQVGFYYLWK